MDVCWCLCHNSWTNRDEILREQDMIKSSDKLKNGCTLMHWQIQAGSSSGCGQVLWPPGRNQLFTGGSRPFPSPSFPFFPLSPLFSPSLPIFSSSLFFFVFPSFPATTHKIQQAGLAEHCKAAKCILVGAIDDQNYADDVNKRLKMWIRTLRSSQHVLVNSIHQPWA